MSERGKKEKRVTLNLYQHEPLVGEGVAIKKRLLMREVYIGREEGSGEQVKLTKTSKRFSLRFPEEIQSQRSKNRFGFFRALINRSSRVTETKKCKGTSRVQTRFGESKKPAPGTLEKRSGGKRPVRRGEGKCGQKGRTSGGGQKKQRGFQLIRGGKRKTAELAPKWKMEWDRRTFLWFSQNKGG